MSKQKYDFIVQCTKSEFGAVCLFYSLAPEEGRCGVAGYLVVGATSQIPVSATKAIPVNKYPGAATELPTPDVFEGAPASSVAAAVMELPMTACATLNDALTNGAESQCSAEHEGGQLSKQGSPYSCGRQNKSSRSFFNAPCRIRRLCYFAWRLWLSRLYNGPSPTTAHVLCLLSKLLMARDI